MYLILMTQILEGYVLALIRWVGDVVEFAHRHEHNTAVVVRLNLQAESTVH